MNSKICFYCLISLVTVGRRKTECKGGESWRKWSQTGCGETLSCNTMTKYHLILLYRRI